MKFYESLIRAHSKGVKIRIVQNSPSANFPDKDTEVLARMGVTEVRSIDWAKFFQGSGILHTKLIIADGESAYVGSANTDWRSLSQVREVGVAIHHCGEIASDILKIFSLYWEASQMSNLPSHWPEKFDTLFNETNPLKVNVEGTLFDWFAASSPSQFCTPHRTVDLDALLHTIRTADALTAAAFDRGVKVRLLFSEWNNTIPFTYQFMHALNSIDNIQVRLITIPVLDFGAIPFARVNHAKFMVTDKKSYVGTSNWSADYFLDTGGVSLNVVNEHFTQQLQQIFDRDWNSPYSRPL